MRVTFHIDQVTVVVVGQNHNPTILHPSFLRNESVIPEDWEVSDGPICTPAFSMVTFANGISFRVDEGRLQISDANHSRNDGRSPLPGLALRYVEALPHVRYRAVGTNFTGFVPREQPEQYLLDRFLTRGSWNGTDLAPTGLGLQLAYPIEDAVVNLTLRSGRRPERQGGDAVDGIAVDANCHTDAEDVSGVRQALGRFDEQLSASLDICEKVLDTGRETNE